MRYELAIQAYDYPELHRAKAGDIIVVRPASGAIGKKERTHLLWLTVSVTNAVVLSGLDQPPLRLSGEWDGTMKRRYAIPFARLKSLMASFDEARARDPLRVYQPFVSLRGDHAMDATQDLPLDQLVLDKRTGDFRRG